MKSRWLIALMALVLVSCNTARAVDPTPSPTATPVPSQTETPTPE